MVHVECHFIVSNSAIVGWMVFKSYTYFLNSNLHIVQLLGASSDTAGVGAGELQCLWQYLSMFAFCSSMYVWEGVIHVQSPKYMGKDLLEYYYCPFCVLLLTRMRQLIIIWLYLTWANVTGWCIQILKKCPALQTAFIAIVTTTAFTTLWSFHHLKWPFLDFSNTKCFVWHFENCSFFFTECL